MSCFICYNIFAQRKNNGKLIFLLKSLRLYGIMTKRLFPEFRMAVSYKRLWKLLIDKDLKKKDLVQLADISGYTINRLTKNENVNTETLVKICNALNCSIEDIMEITRNEE